MRPIGAILCLCLLRATAALADGPGELPLEHAKSELKVLRPDGTVRRGDAATPGLADGMPTVAGPVPGAVSPVPVTLPEDRMTSGRRAKDPKQNWLVDGVAKLEQEDRLRRSRSERDTDQAHDGDGGPANPANGGDRLVSQAKVDLPSGWPRTTPQRRPGKRVDPLAPFLQNWLARSSGSSDFFWRNVATANLEGKQETELLSARFPGEQARPPQPDATGRNAMANLQPNPYVQSLPDSWLAAPQPANRPNSGSSIGQDPVDLGISPADRTELLLPLPPAEKKPTPYVPEKDPDVFPRWKKF